MQLMVLVWFVFIYLHVPTSEGVALEAGSVNVWQPNLQTPLHHGGGRDEFVVWQTIQV
jgi:hypothetical protein